MDSNKENHEQEEARTEEPSPSIASPRISSVGASEDAAGSSRHVERFHEPQDYVPTAGHDHLHWGGVGRRVGQPHDARSIASSAATRDDKSIFEEPGVQDVAEEGDEQDDDGEHEEAPEEITLTPDNLRGGNALPGGARLRTESSNVESTYTGISAAGSLTEVVEQLADQALSGELSPRQAAAIRSAARDHDGNTGRSGVRAPELGSSDGVSVGGPAQSSMALSEDNWQASGARTGEGMETIPLHPAAGAEDDAAPMQHAGVEDPAQASTKQRSEDGMEAQQLAATPAEVPETESVSLAAATDPLGASQANQPAAALPVSVAAAEPSSPPEPAEALLTAAVPAATYHSRFMQQLAASTSEDDLAVYTADAQGVPQEAVRQASPGEPQREATSDGARPATTAARPAAMQPLSVAGGVGGSNAKSTAEASAALAAINGAGGSNGAAEGQAPAQPGLLFPPSWYKTFHGLLYMDGVDALGRPVVVLNADAVPSNMKSSALVYIKAHVEPLVNQGDYVLVFTSRGTARLPSMWIMGAYRSLPRPFRKNVQYIILVRPSAFLRTVLAFMRPFVSKKAGRKVKQVQSVHEIATATGGEVTLQSLGPAFAAEQLPVEAASMASGGDGSP